MTIINLTSLAILAVTCGKRRKSRLDPTDPVDVILLFDKTGKRLQAALDGSADPMLMENRRPTLPDDWEGLQSRPLLDSKS